MMSLYEPHSETGPSMPTIAMLSTFLALCLIGLFFVARCFGQVIKIRGLGLFAAHGLSYASKSCTISVDKISIKFHLPRPQAPYWAIITGEKFEYEDSSCHASLDRLQAKLWFFPTHFRFTAGPWIETTLDGFVVDVVTSKNAPWWINTLRTNLVTTILNGDTILLHTINTKLYFGTVTKAQNGHTGDVERPGLNEGEANDELRVRCLISQWNISTPVGRRMYSFGTLTAELRRSWVEDRGTFVMIAEECRWIKLRNIEAVEDQTVLWMLLSTICSLPRSIVPACMDPMSLIDIYAPQCDITFHDFRLRDAELFHEGAIKTRQEYDLFVHQNPGVLENIAWDIFVGGVLSSFQD